VNSATRWTDPDHGSVHLPADLRRWDSPVPLVLLKGICHPYTDRRPPLSGIDGDVQSPSNILWLRNANPDRYLVSLAEAGVIELDVTFELSHTSNLYYR